MIHEKMQQAFTILQEQNVDLWLTFGRESHTSHDPSAEMIVGTSYTWASAFMLTRDGRSIAIVGSLDAAELKKRGDYQEIIVYVGGMKDTLVQFLTTLNPTTIAINFSLDDVMADGLTHGMYLKLMEYLEGTGLGERIISSENIVSELRGRKSPQELRLIRHTIAETDALYEQIHHAIRPGMTEKEVADLLLEMVHAKGYETAWDEAMCPSVFTGMPTEGEAHTGPSNKVIARGHVLNMDFGLKINGYCSDLQRTAYVLREGETEPPEAVKRGFQTIIDAIEKAAAACKPGAEGWEVDAVARQWIRSQGYDDFPHGLGHQVGKAVHDGAGGLFPRWERYGRLPYLKIVENQVYTIEPRLRIDGYGTATVEEMVVVTPEGGQFLSAFQRQIWLIG